jgi:acyl-CoA synthetase (AMP-forming)/AMP-acid ligase II
LHGRRAPRSAASRWEAAPNPWRGAIARCSRTGSSNPSPSSGESTNFRSFSPDGWFATGDIGVLDENGYLKIVDRKKELIIRGGANIYPREIEEVLYQHPKVLEAAAIGVPDPRLGERVCACVVPQSGQSLTLDELVAFLRDKIAIYKLPEFLHLLDALPRTPTGKVQKGLLRGIVLKGGAQA